MDTIAQLQSFADDRNLHFDVAHAFAALDPDTTYRPVGGMEYIEPATPAEIAWASANVRPLTPPDQGSYRHESQMERWRNSARALGVFTPETLRQHVAGSERHIKPMIQRMLSASEIECIREHRRFVCPATYRWIGGNGSSPPTCPVPGRCR